MSMLCRVVFNSVENASNGMWRNRGGIMERAGFEDLSELCGVIKRDVMGC